MTTPTLVIGNRNYSSWSLRGYLALALAEIEFDVRLIQLDTKNSAAELATASPSAKVPVLQIGGEYVWESLAIGEWAAEKSGRGWPAAADARTHARCVSAEMHAGFNALRNHMPMNIRGSHPGVGHSREALADIETVIGRWREARARFGAGGKFLYGDDFTIADAMYAPVTTRLITYGVELATDIHEYIAAVATFPPMAAWIRDAADETWTVAIAEPTSPEWVGGPLASASENTSSSS